jgi:hypothetical protein
MLCLNPHLRPAQSFALPACCCLLLAGCASGVNGLDARRSIGARTLAARRALKAGDARSALENASQALSMADRAGGDTRTADLLIECADIQALAVLRPGPWGEASPDAARLALAKGIERLARKGNVLRLKYRLAVVELAGGRPQTVMALCRSALEEDRRLQEDPDTADRQRLPGAEDGVPVERSPDVFLLLGARAMMQTGETGEALALIDAAEAACAADGRRMAGAAEARYCRALCLLAQGLQLEAFDAAQKAASAEGFFYVDVPAEKRLMLVALTGLDIVGKAADGGLPDLDADRLQVILGSAKTAAVEVAKRNPENVQAADAVKRLDAIKPPAAPSGSAPAKPAPAAVEEKEKK